MTHTNTSHDLCIETLEVGGGGAHVSPSPCSALSLCSEEMEAAAAFLTRHFFVNLRV